MGMGMGMVDEDKERGGMGMVDKNRDGIGVVDNGRDMGWRWGRGMGNWKWSGFRGDGDDVSDG